TEDVETLLEDMVRDSELPLLGVVPEDENIKAYDLLGKPIIDLPEDSKAVIAVKSILEKLNLLH
ncbi:MAG: hypothetical protein ACXQTS_07460, partial [Candidatus Methanospirareceae archaeon]